MSEHEVELTSEERLRDLLGRIGFGDGVAEPMADNDTVVEFVDAAVMDQGEHRECPIVCELCGERLADKPCSHCGGCGANVALSTASLAYAECEWCAGVGKVHEGCRELSYADLAARLADAEARAEAAEADRDEAWKVAAQRRNEARRYYVAWQVARMRARALRADQ